MTENGVFHSGKLEGLKELGNEKNREAKIMPQADLYCLLDRMESIFKVDVT